MRADLRPAGVRSLCALIVLFGGTSLACAQFSTAIVPRSEKDIEPPAATFRPIERESATTVAPVERTSTAPPAPREAKSSWPIVPRSLRTGRTQIENHAAQTTAPKPLPEESPRKSSAPASPVEIAAEKIKAEEAAAPARRAAIRYLASVQCQYYPEAEAALVAALRSDRNELVRIEAAQALAECCCCTPKTMEALHHAAGGSDRDGCPVEISERVKTAAQVALRRYAARGMSLPKSDATAQAIKESSANDIERANYTTLPLRLAGAAAGKSTPGSLQLTGATIPPPPSASNAIGVADADRRFAETAGSTPRSSPSSVVSPPPSQSTTPRTPSVLPEIRLRPIGVVAPMRQN